MAAPSKQELAILEQFRERLQDLKLEQDKSTDMYLLRWLRARDMKLSQAEEMIRKSLKWRQENDLDTILTWKAPTHFLENYKIDYIGSDSDNSPVALLPFGRWDLKKLIQMGHKNDYIRYIDQIFERLLTIEMKDKVTSDGVQVTQFVFVVDMNYLSLSTLSCKGAIEAILENVVHFESNYPESMKACYVINASRVFTILFSLMKPLLSQRTFGKIYVYSNNASKWQPVLFNIISRDKFPVVLGGTSTLPSCLDVVDLHPSEVTVAAGSIVPLTYKVDQKDTILKWSFKTDHYDIDYSLHFVNDDKSRKEQLLVPGQRVEFNEGIWTCQQPGTYIFKFDNSFSRFRSKVINYNIDLIVTANEE